MRLIFALFVASLLAVAGTVPAHAYEKLPDTTLKLPAMAPEQSVSTWIPSSAGEGESIAVNVIYPARVRYKKGAPVVVVVPGGDSASGLEFSTHASQVGLIEVRFAFPGGGKPGFASTGVYDYRGPKSQIALRDVLRFAAGKTKDVQGRFINKVVPAPVDAADVGVIGWSNGGNTAVTTLARYSNDLPFVSWLVFYESPLGPLFYPPSLGSAQDLIGNRHYRQGSAATGHALVDYRKLWWQPVGQKNPGLHKKLGQPEIPGVLFFDENGNHEWDEEVEFALPYAVDANLNKQIYPPQATRALQRIGNFSKDWPKTVATVSESEKYFQDRDGSLYLNQLAKQRPDLLVCVFASQLDHMQRQADHPHISLNYNAWLANKVKFVRLNPDPVYVGSLAYMNANNFVDNKPNSSIDASAMEEFLEPEGLVPDFVYIDAASAELADRQHLHNFSETLTAPLATYWNGVLAQPGGENTTKPPTP